MTSRLPTFGMTRVLFAAMLVGTVSSRVQATPPLAEPLWTARLQPAIAWAAELGRAANVDEPWILVAAEDGRLYALAEADGRMLAQPLRARPGVRLSGPSDAGGLVCCFDRHTVYTLFPGGRPQELWQFGQAPAAPAVFDDDPEQLSSWAAVQPTGAGILALSSDGSLFMLARENGRARRQWYLGALSAARLHADEKLAAVLWQTRGKTRVAFVDLASSPAALDTRDLDTHWPLYSSLAGDGLVTVNAERVTLCPRGGEPGSYKHGANSVRAAGVAVWSGTPTGSKSAHQNSSKLLLADGPRVIALELGSGRSCWTVDCGVESPALVALFTCRDLCLVQYDCGVMVIAIQTGKCLLRHFRAGLEVVAAHLGDNRVCVVCAPPDQPATPAELAVLPLNEGREAAAPAPVARLRLPRTQRWLSCLWTERRLVVVEPHELRAYPLPGPP